MTNETVSPQTPSEILALAERLNCEAQYIDGYWQMTSAHPVSCAVTDDEIEAIQRDRLSPPERFSDHFYRLHAVWIFAEDDVVCNDPDCALKLPSDLGHLGADDQWYCSDECAQAVADDIRGTRQFHQTMRQARL